MWVLLPRECSTCHLPQTYKFRDYNPWHLLGIESDDPPVQITIPLPYCPGCSATFVSGFVLDYVSAIAVLALLQRTLWSGSEVQFLRKFLGFVKQEFAETIDAKTYSEADITRWETFGLSDQKQMTQIKDILKGRLTPNLPIEDRL